MWSVVEVPSRGQVKHELDMSLPFCARYIPLRLVPLGILELLPCARPCGKYFQCILIYSLTSLYR